MKKSNLSIYTLSIVAFIFISTLLSLEAFDYSTRSLAEQAIISPYSSSNEEIVSVTMIPEDRSFQAGKPLWMLFQFKMGPEWHLYWKNPGDAGAAPTVRWSLPEGFTAGEMLWPFPERYVINDAVVFGYSKQLLLLAPIYPPENLHVGDAITIKAEVNWLGCATLCVPGNAFFTMTLPVTANGAETNQQAISLFKHARKWLPVDGTVQSDIANDALKMKVQSNVPLKNITSVTFFPEQEGLFDIHKTPSYELSGNGKELVVQLAGLNQKNLKMPLKGVLVVKDAAHDGPKTHAWNIQVGDSHQVAISEKGARHIEALESQVWYRRILVAVNDFTHSTLAKVLLFAFLGGILLNIMPCVLPVISMKMLHFVELQKSGRKVQLKHGLIYSLGILVAFWALAGAIILLQTFGKAVGWGFQLQEPLFVALLVMVLFILGLGLFGLFEFGVGIASFAGNLDEEIKRVPSLLASFLSGVLATFVASPCTGPLLGSAIGFAATLEPVYSLMVFTSLGVGMALPFLLVSFIPGVARLVPRPGRWMITFKQLMGFFLIATVLWLLWVLEAETTNLSLLKLLVSFFIVSVAVWIYGTWGGLDRRRVVRTIAKVISLFMLLLGLFFFFKDVYMARIRPGTTIEPSSQAIGKNWERFSLQTLERLRAQKVPVFVAATAKWCLTCQANHAILDSKRVEEAFIRHGVVKLVADWTTGDEEITKYLRSLGRNGVPMYAIYPVDPKQPPIILPEVITPEIIIEALDRAYAEKPSKTGKW